MIYGALLAGGMGKRLENSDLPKQFICIEGIPIIILTLKKMLKIEKFQTIFIAVNHDWIEYTQLLLKEHLSKSDLDRISIVCGGKERFDSFFSIMNEIIKRKGINDSDIVVYLDAVRPLVKEEIIEKCIEETLNYKLATVVTHVTHTILLQNEYGDLDGSLDREKLFEIHSPEGFNLQLLYDVYKNLNPDIIKRATCTSQIMVMLGYKVKKIIGSKTDFKITNNFDLDMARYIIEKNIELG